MSAREALLRGTIHALTNASADPADLLGAVATQAATALHALSGFMRVSAAGDQLEPIAVGSPLGPSGNDRPDLVVKPLMLGDGSQMARAVLEARTVHIPELSEAYLRIRFADPADFEVARRLDLRAALFVPVRVAERVVGLLSLIRCGADALPFEPEEMEAAEQLAELAALALVNSTLVREARERAARLELSSSLTRDFARAGGSYQDLLEVIVRRIGETLGDSCAIRMVREDARGFAVHVAAYNRDPALQVRHAEALRALGANDHAGLAGRALAARASILVPRVDLPTQLSAAPEAIRALLSALASTSLLAVPLLMHDVPLAVMVLGRSTGSFTVDDQRLVEDLAAHAAIAVSNARLLETTTRSVERLRLLTEASAAFAAGVGHPQEMLHTVARRLNALFGGQCEIQIDASYTPLPPHPNLIELPLRAGAEVIGNLVLTRGDAYTEDDRQFAQELVTHAALAIRNSRLLEAVQHELAERARAEAALRASEERLRHAQKMEAIGRLAGGVAHDFNNLLSVVLTSCDFIEEAQPPPALLEDVGQIRRAGERAAELTRQLLAFSRQQPIEPQVLDLNVQVSQVRALLRRLLGEDIALITKLGSGLGSVVADATHIEQVLMNLAINARDAMPRGGTLTIRTSSVVLDDSDAAQLREVPPGAYVLMAVSDTGEGMTEATRERIFEPFFTTKPRGKGTGLGLSTVFGIVSQNGGAIRARSSLGHGTTFEVYLPRSEAVAETHHDAPQIGSLRGDETVLLAEDEDALRKILVEILSRGGYRVIETSNGRDALAAFERHAGAFDLVMTDVVMPGMSGGELVSHLRAQQPDLKVLFMSGYPDDSYLHHHPLAPDCPLLQKPLQPGQVLRKVREVLDACAR